MANRTFRSFAFSLTATLSLSGCDTEPAKPDTEFRSTPWSEVVCTLGTSDRCYSKTAESPELLLSVVSRCDLQELVDAGELTPTTDGWFYSCDFGGRPESFTDVLCFYDSFTSVVCYGGSGGWYTMVEPACAWNEYTVTAWVSGGCSPDLDPGPHEYDSVMISPNGPLWLARAVDGMDAVMVVPRCHVPVGAMNVPASPLSCNWDGGQPCCWCDDLGILSCVAFESGGYSCPAGTSTSVMACADSGSDTADTTVVVTP